MKRMILTLFMIMPLFLYGQQVVLGGGGEATGSGGTVSYSIGQIAYTSKGAGGTVSEGVQQAFEVTNLPIELLYFEAELLKTREVELSWETATELNNDYFTVERSISGTTYWEYVGKVSGSGTTTKRHSYELLDDAPYLGKSYYRLKQTDYDGAYSYSETRAVYLEKRLELSLYPNPTYGKLTIGIEMSAGDEVSLAYELFGPSGKMVKEGMLDAALNTLDISSLPIGVYWLRVGDEESKKISERIIKIKE
jgi:hypothetical protein